MMQRNRIVVALLGAGLLGSGGAQAELFDRGSGLLYDSVLNVTWLEDASYAKTSGYDADGRMTWDELTTPGRRIGDHDSVRNYDYTDWRLPTIGPVKLRELELRLFGRRQHRPYLQQHQPAGRTGLHVLREPRAEGRPFAERDCPRPRLWHIPRWHPGPGQADVGLVRNLQSDGYWYGTSFEPTRQPGRGLRITGVPATNRRCPWKPGCRGGRCAPEMSWSRYHPAATTPRRYPSRKPMPCCFAAWAC